MSILKPGEESMHYSDGGHRWCCPTEGDDELWRIRIQAHVAAHREAPDAGRSPGSGLGPGRPTGQPTRDLGS